MSDASPLRAQLRSSLPFLLLFLAALLPRVIGLCWGLPSAEHWYSYHPDEQQMAGAIARVASGNWNPGFFNYPSLYIYLSYFCFLIAGPFLPSHIANDSTYWTSLHDIILSARLVTALLGAATIPVVFALARRLFEARMAGVAALLMAFAPAHIQHSHFATVDVPATFFVAVTLWLAARGVDGEAKSLVWAAFVAGLATATKYNAVIVFMAPLTALAMSKAPSKYFAWSFGALVIGFLLGCPFSVLAPRDFWGDGQNTGFSYELLVHPRIGHGEIFLQSGNGWWHHLGFNLPFALTLPVLLLALTGIICAARDQNHRKYFGPLLAFALLYFLAIGTSQVRFLRYVFPLLPALCVFAAWALRAAPSKYFAPAAVALLLTTFGGAINALWPFVQTDPRDQAARWIASRESSAQRTIIGVAERPWFQTLPLTKTDDPPPIDSNSDFISADNRFEVRPLGWDVARLAEAPPKYFVLSEFEWRDKERLKNRDYQSFMAALNGGYQLAATFKNRSPLELPGRSFVPYDWLYSNPEIWVYQRR